MRLVPGLIALLFLSGCGGYVVIESRSDGPVPQTVPAPVPHSTEIGRQAAVRIALAEAAAHDCGALEVEHVEPSKKRWDIELRGRCCQCGKTEIRVRVSRRTGEVLSYKVKRHHRDDDDDDRDDDRGKCDVH